MDLEKKIQSKININKIPREITKKLQPYCTVPLRGIGVPSGFGMASTSTPLACSYTITCTYMYMQPLINGVFLNSEKYSCMLNKPNSHWMDPYIHVHVYSIYSQPLTKFEAKKYCNITKADWWTVTRNTYSVTCKGLWRASSTWKSGWTG